MKQGPSGIVCYRPSLSGFVLYQCLPTSFCAVAHVQYVVFANCFPCFLLQICDIFQVLVAATKAVGAKSNGKLKTRSINSEVLFSLSPSNNVSAYLDRTSFHSETRFSASCCSVHLWVFCSKFPKFPVLRKVLLPCSVSEPDSACLFLRVFFFWGGVK